MTLKKKKSKTKNPFKENKHEILYNIINCLIAGSLVFLGNLTAGNITLKGIILALVVFGIAFITKFKRYWETQEHEYSAKLFNFIGG